MNRDNINWYAAFLGVAIVASIVGGFLGLLGAVAIKVLF
jgi:hypothetical protein